MYYGTELWKNRISLQLVRQSFSSGREILTFPDLPGNLYEALLNTADKYPDKNAIIDNYNRHWTYSELKNKVNLFSSYLKFRKNVKKGSRVALMLYNSLEFCVSFIALAKLGAITIPLPTKYKEQEVKSLIRKSNVEYIICDHDFTSWFSDDQSDSIILIESADAEKGYGFAALGDPALPTAESAGNSEDTALLIFTSGTTSQSKGVIIKNFNIMHAIAVYQKILNITAADISIIPIPIYHITGLVALLGLFIYAGGTLFLHKYFDANRVLTCVQDNHATFLHASPTIFSMLMAEAETFPELPSLKKLACGSSNMPKEKLLAIHKWLNHCTFFTVYGLTETTSPAAIFPGDACTSRFIGSSGFPIPGTRFAILNEEGQELPANSVGEIWISGAVVLESYYQVTSSSLKDGWLGTGDLGYFTPEGYLFVVDRKKDMINRGGEKIWSFDVENELYKIPGITEAAVVGIPDEMYGETAAAAVKLNPRSTLTEIEIQKALSTMIAKYKIPTKILFLNAIPVTPNGKIDKKAIKKLFQ